jgi:hypothetical protein
MPVDDNVTGLSPGVHHLCHTLRASRAGNSTTRAMLSTTYHTSSWRCASEGLMTPG